jgi:uncharacterized protein YggE
MRTQGYVIAGVVWAMAMLPMAGRGMAQAGVIRPAASENAISGGITVQGHAELKVMPDIGYLTVGVTTQALHQTDATAQNAKISTAVLSALHDAGVVGKDILTTDYNAQPQYDYKPSPPVLTGYQVNNTIRVTVRDLRDAGTIIDKVTAAGATNVSDLSFDLADRTAAEQQALALAVKNAAAKAEAMAQAAGVSRGPLLNLTEGSPDIVRPLVFARSMMAKDAAAPTTPVESTEITISADVTATYSIGQ